MWVPLETNDNVGPVQSIGQSFIRQLRVSIGGTEIFDSGNLYAYLTYIKNELTFNRDYKKNFLSSIGYYRDEVDQSRSDNEGHVARMNMAHEGRIFETYAKLDFDLSNQERYLLNNLDLLFTIYQNDDRFLIKAYDHEENRNFRLRVHSVKMFVRSLEVQSSVNVSLMKALEQQTAKYCMRRLQIRPTFLNQARTEVTQNVFANFIPRRLVIALVNNRGYVGDFARSPFDFKSYNLREISVNAGGVNYPMCPYNARFDNDQDPHIMRLFTQMHQSTSLLPHSTNGIDFERFCDGWTFFVLQLTASGDDSEGFELLREGVTTVRLQFNAPLPEPVTMLVLGEFDSLLQIDRNRVAISDGAV